MLTKGEREAIRTILSAGGKVFVTMGRAKPRSVRTAVVNRLAERGLVRTWVPRGVCFLNGLSFISGETVDIMVTAEGCKAYMGV